MLPFNHCFVKTNVWGITFLSQIVSINPVLTSHIIEINCILLSCVVTVVNSSVSGGRWKGGNCGENVKGKRDVRRGWGGLWEWRKRNRRPSWAGLLVFIDVYYYHP